MSDYLRWMLVVLVVLCTFRAIELGPEGCARALGRAVSTFRTEAAR
jgi:hypothetical protein